MNVRNLGVGDMRDVMSGVVHLISQGFIDEDRMGAMGWSQGGYFSAFLTTNTDRFKAISVGAGISKPKAIRAAMIHNLEWFDEWVFVKRRRTSK